MNISIVIQGKTPLLLNRFSDEAQHSATRGTRIAAVGYRGEPREQAEKKLYIGQGTAGQSKARTMKTESFDSPQTAYEYDIYLLMSHTTDLLQRAPKMEFGPDEIAAIGMAYDNIVSLMRLMERRAA